MWQTDLHDDEEQQQDDSDLAKMLGHFHVWQ